MDSGKQRLKNISKIFDPDFNERIAFCDIKDNSYISYGQVCDWVYYIAKKINVQHPEPASVLLFLGHGLSFVIGLFGIIAAGKVPVLINNKLRQELKSVPPLYDLVLTDENNYRHLREFSNTNNKIALFCDFEGHKSSEIDLSLPEDIQDDTMLFLFTSGSTGESKPVCKSYENIMTEINYLKNLLDAEPEDLFLPLSPSFYHIYTLLLAVFLPFFVGAKVRLDIPFAPIKIVEDGFLRGANIIIATPERLSAISDFIPRFANEDFSHIKHCVSSTMSLDQEIINDFHNSLGISIVELYGSTETGGIAYRRFYENPLYQFFPMIEWRIAEDTEELELKSPLVSNVDPESKDDNWYLTGDVIEIGEGQKEFKLLGRTNQIIKVGGNRVSALEVEETLRGFYGIEDIVVIGLNSQTTEECIGAFVVPFHHEETNVIKDLKKYCNEKLAPFKVPKTFTVLDTIPRGVDGKVKYHELPEIDCN